MKWNPHLLITAIGALLFIPFIGQVHLFDWDELNFAEISREMIVTGDYLNVRVNYQPFYEKPPLFFWLQVISMKIFGVNEFAARFPNALVGISALNFMFWAGKRHRDERMGWLWVAAYLGSLLPFFYFKSGIIDPLFNLLITIGVWQYFQYQNDRSNKRGIYAGVLIGAAILTKGPVALLVWGLVVFVDMLIRRFDRFPSISFIFLFIISLLVTGGSWFILQILNGDLNVVLEFINVQVALFSSNVAGHAQPWYYHPVVLFFGCFPISIIALRQLFSKHKVGEASYYMSLFFWVVLILFSIVKTKIVHYSSLTYYPLAFLAAHALYHRFHSRKWMNTTQWISFAFVALLLTTIFIVLPIIGNNLPELTADVESDPYTKGMLSVRGPWMGWEWFIGVFFGLGILGILLFTRRYRLFRLLLFPHVAISMFLIMRFYVPSIEPVTQGGAIAFYESLRGKDVYLTTLSMKSYGYLFYSDAQPQENPNYTNRDWLLNGDIDKPAYFVLRSNKLDQYLQNPNLSLVEERGGYVLLVREMEE